jgi:hypothetical protein
MIKIISTRYFLVIKEINKYLVDMILINKKKSFRSGLNFGSYLYPDAPQETSNKEKS